jgi:tyrosyl-tRNA synthetase
MSATPAFRPVDEQLAALRKGVAEIIREEELRAKLERSRASGKPLRVKLGVDPTGPDLTLGHTVVLRKLKHFQDQGHTAIFLIGDFTALVGDPTGQSETRSALSPEQVKANAETYLAQAYKILDRERTEVRYNSEWLGKLTSYEIVKLQGHCRLARMLEHEDFRSRLQNNQPISVHELLYPLLQAYDSVILKADVELGATEQKFNLLTGRDIQHEYGQESQVVLTMPILVGLDGQRKMSKSLGNYIGVAESPSQIFGKVMSISDEVMWTYYELLTDFTMPVIVRLQEEIRTGVMHPMEVKMQLAHNIIAGFHGEEAAKKATDEFQRVFRDRAAPEEVAERKLPRGGLKKLSVLLVELELSTSRSEAERLIKQGGVEINGERAADVKKELDLSKSGDYLLRAGKKKFLRVVVE